MGLVNGEKNAKESFSCPGLVPFKYPFYNVRDTRCGLIKVNCTSKGDADFDPHYYMSYNRCNDRNFYYKYGDETFPSDLPQTCHVVQLPGKWPSSPGIDETNIFSLLSSNISILFELSPHCIECQKKGRVCNTTENGNDVQCLDVKWVSPSKERTQLEKHNSHKTIKILVIAGSALILILALVIFIILPQFLRVEKRKTGWRKKAKYNVKFEMFLKNHEFLAPKRFSYAQVEKMTNSFKFELGQGGFGTVYKGALGNQNLVAVKILSELKGDGEDFINEVASVGRTSHVNIVSLIGFCLEGRKKALIYEFMPNGSLERFIYNRDSSNSSHLGWEKLHQIAIGIARGLEYLHRGCGTRILHFDIKPHNILLDNDFCPKISDFGLAKLFREKESKISMSRMRGTPGYIAPELFSRNFGQVSHKSDVYSYGMMILEMVGGRKNIEVGVDHTSEIYFPHWIYKKVELHEDQLGLTEIVTDEENRIAKKMIIVGLWCIQTSPFIRPTITRVLEMLEGELESLEIPPKPYLSSPPRSSSSV
ncbi:putative glycerophosphodiester phosphodiesterase, protein kinase RLK-Pelle-LRK10L-2 family [Helianthus annuus]|nr:putative glycerophosphodiester phosphodiesterase, protein kinase RLK-Pelle-LRK10L-2 family [Helianthus annuus]KAJ0472761.1 putative glycerophosphodiester phosphodiesterase, protein kinase RLK-Pelle-LRK10L-2 family [Helianthus annuus]KAJ0648368.1 putative glycerophosphodiester phosphodiesterase, protein kinase RLK-Pelle-LRK10L-2 family [Helianthus annuus]KAJ0652198.1 putative glycerophosphodiester phosphodiesterase, protein kinase RLK-Pelle-LRK10L-2 family [Helianthus annuus]